MCGGATPWFGGGVDNASVARCLENETDMGFADCMDAGVITIIAPTTAVVSIIAIALYCLLDFFVRCQKECCSTPVRPGVAAAFGVAVALQLFQGSFVYFMIGRVSD